MVKPSSFGVPVNLIWVKRVDRQDNVSQNFTYLSDFDQEKTKILSEANWRVSSRSKKFEPQFEGFVTWAQITRSWVWIKVVNQLWFGMSVLTVNSRFDFNWSLLYCTLQTWIQSQLYRQYTPESGSRGILLGAYFQDRRTHVGLEFKEIGSKSLFAVATGSESWPKILVGLAHASHWRIQSRNWTSKIF